MQVVREIISSIDQDIRNTEISSFQKRINICIQLGAILSTEALVIKLIWINHMHILWCGF